MELIKPANTCPRVTPRDNRLTQSALPTESASLLNTRRYNISTYCWLLTFFPLYSSLKTKPPTTYAPVSFPLSKRLVQSASPTLSGFLPKPIRYSLFTKSLVLFSAVAGSAGIEASSEVPHRLQVRRCSPLAETEASVTVYQFPQLWLTVGMDCSLFPYPQIHWYFWTPAALQEGAIKSVLISR